MRRSLIILFGILFGCAVLVLAQYDTNASNAHSQIEPVNDADQMVNGVWVPVELEPIADPNVSFDQAMFAGNDTCGALLFDNLPTFNEVGDTWTSSDVTLTNGYSTDSTDPNLAACIDNIYPITDTQGYRTAWYRFTAPATGQLTIETIPNGEYEKDFDTVIALYQAFFCSSVSPSTRLACNDDANGLLSKIESYVVQGEAYFIEIADRNLSINGEARANILVQIETYSVSSSEPAWNVTANGQPNGFRSRHSTVVIDNEIYVFGGQTIVDEIVSTRTDTTAKFNPTTGTWTALAPMHENCDPQGYSNTGAAYVIGTDNNVPFRRVYLPSGFVGENGTYKGVHCIYHVDANTWSFDTVNTVPWTTGQPAIYSVAVSRSDNQGYLVAGGLNGDWLGTTAVSTALTDTHEFFGTPNTWGNSSPPGLNTARYAHTGVIAGSDKDQFCVVGGLQPGATSVRLLADGECLNTLTMSQWDPIPGNITPRFNAASYVDADGNWYVFGGVDATLNAVPTTEKYDFDTNTWTILDDRFSFDNPPRAWMRGGVVDNAVYLIGGETNIDGSANGSVAGIVTKFEFGPTLKSLNQKLYLPLMFERFFERSLAQQAIPIWIDRFHTGNFFDSTERYHVYEIEVTQPTNYQLNLINIPSGPNNALDNYDLLLYSESKVLIETGDAIGNSDELITGTLQPGKYYVMVVVVLNHIDATGDYQLWFRNN